MEERHKFLGSELKHLYTAITRAKVRLWLYESNDDSHAHIPALWYWKEYGNLVDHMTVTQLIKTRGSESESSPEDWRERGEEFMQHCLWELALMCYDRAKCPQKTKECRALKYYHIARNSQNRAEKQEKYLSAAIEFLQSDEKEHQPKLLYNAAKCLSNGRYYEEAGWLLSKMEKVRNIAL